MICLTEKNMLIRKHVAAKSDWSLIMLAKPGLLILIGQRYFLNISYRLFHPSLKEKMLSVKTTVTCICRESLCFQTC